MILFMVYPYEEIYKEYQYQKIKDILYGLLLGYIRIRYQICNRGEIFGATSAMLGQNLPPLVGIGLRYLKI